MMRYLKLILTAFLLLPGLIFAKSDAEITGMKFDRISIEQGLSQVTIYTLIQDHRGFIWIGTMDGLNKYDGYDFTVYRHNSFDSISVSNNRVRVIYEDQNNNLWIGTDDGLNFYDPNTDKFTSILKIPGKTNSITSNVIQTICEDEEGLLWIGTANGLNRYDPVTGVINQFLSKPDENNSLIHNSINVLHCDENNNLWIGTAAGLQMRQNTTGKFVTISDPLLQQANVLSLYEDREHIMWVGTSSGLLHVEHSAENNFNIIDKSNIFGRKIPPAVNRCLQDWLSNIWIGTSNGLYKIASESNAITCYNNSPDDVLSISHDEVIALIEDAGHNLWIGTYGGGVNKIELRTGNFQGITYGSIEEKFIYCIAEDLSGNLWVGSNAGVKVFDQNMRYLTEYQVKTGTGNSISDNRIRSILVDKTGRVFIGNYGGMDIYNPNIGKFVNYSHDPDNQYSLSENTVIHIFQDSKEQIWVGTQGGLNRFDKNSSKFIRFQHNPNDPASISENQIRRIFEDQHGNLWIGTYGGGLNLFNPVNNSFTVFKNVAGQPESLSSNFIYSIFEDSQSNLWIGTYGGGLNRYNDKSGTFEKYRKQQGLTNDLVYGILEDNNKNLWLSTNHGIFKFKYDAGIKDIQSKNTSFRNYDMGDGLLSNEFNFGAYFKSSQGLMFFGCINGLNYFQPEHIQENITPPRVAITGFYIANVPVDIQPTGPLTQHINQIDEIDLSYKDNILTFEFAGLHYSNSAKNKYAYMLEGVDEDWVYTDASRRYATYTTLPGSEYTFKVKASNSDGIWNETGKQIKLSITPPFWNTLIFRIGLAIIFIASLIFITRFRTRQIKLRNRYLESINAELNKNIHHRKKVEYDLQESEEKYRTLTTNLNAGIFRIKPQGKGKFIEVNPALIKIFGYKNKSEILNISVESLFQDPNDRKIFIKDINKMGFIENRELLLTKKDGSPVWCSINAVSVKNESGDIIYHDGLIDDITEKKLMENRIRQTQKMEAIGQLAGGVAHDFNNILTVIQGHAELGMMKIDETNQVFRDLREIHTSGERAGNLTRQLLAFSRKQPMTLQILDINTVITNLEKMVRRLIGEDINIKINLAENLPAINADPGQLEQILLNILINARDAINANNNHNGRTILIDTQYAELDKEFMKHHPGSKSGPHILMAISDTGTGMDEKIKSKIFDPFFTTKEPGKGTGLGLATVFGIVKQNDGSIYVVSEPEKGTTFTIYWPAVKQSIPRQKSASQNKKKLEGKESILLVEDDDAVRLFTGEILKNLGYNVEQAAQGAAALKLIKEKKFKPQLVITDIIMPQMNGRELADKINEELPGTKVLLMSGYSDNQISMDGKLDKDVNFIAKPFSINNFAHKIREVLRK